MQTRAFVHHYSYSAARLSAALQSHESATISSYGDKAQRSTGFWVVLGAFVGLIQELGTILLVLPRGGPSTNRSEEFGIYGAIAILYGMGWLSSAFLLSDFLFLRRGLEPREFKQFLGIVLGCALVLGLALPGFGLMVGFPLTAIVILITGYAFKKRAADSSVVRPSV